MGKSKVRFTETLAKFQLELKAKDGTQYKRLVEKNQEDFDALYEKNQADLEKAKESLKREMELFDSL